MADVSEQHSGGKVWNLSSPLLRRAEKQKVYIDVKTQTERSVLLFLGLLT